MNKRSVRGVNQLTPPKDFEPEYKTMTLRVGIYPITGWLHPNGDYYPCHPTDLTVANIFSAGHDAYAKAICFQILELADDVMKTFDNFSGAQQHLMDNGWGRIDINHIHPAKFEDFTDAQIQALRLINAHKPTYRDSIDREKITAILSRESIINDPMANEIKFYNTQDIQDIQDIQDLVLAGFDDWASLGNVSARHLDRLTLFNYTAQAIYDGNWNYFETVSRGLIIDNQTGEIVARPFDKFWNWGEGDRTTDASIASIQSKIDGSLGILYRHNGKHHIATRGSFDSEQARWATKYLNENHNLEELYPEMTLLFEIIYPDNRIVVDYGDYEGLVLLAGRNRHTGEYLSQDEVLRLADDYLFKTPDLFNSSVEQLIGTCQRLSANYEGYVVTFADGQRFKFKSLEYLRIHKIITNLSKKRVLEYMKQGNLKSKIFDVLPDEFSEQVKIWEREIFTEHLEMVSLVNNHFEFAPKSDRKAFAEYVTQKHRPISHYLFAKWDGKDVGRLILEKHNFKVSENGQ